MNEFKLLAIRQLYDWSKVLIKILKLESVYSFYHDNNFISRPVETQSFIPVKNLTNHEDQIQSKLNYLWLRRNRKVIFFQKFNFSQSRATYATTILFFSAQGLSLIYQSILKIFYTFA